MTFEEAVNDPKRPLSLTPREWMYSVEAQLAEEEELVENTARRIASERKESEDSEPQLPKDSGTGIEKIDMGLDQMVSGCMLVDAGIRESNMADLAPELRKRIEKIRDLNETAIMPYLKDMIEEADKIE